MKWIKKIKKKFIRDKLVDEKYNRNVQNSNKHRKSQNVEDLTENVKNPTVSYSYENFGKLKVYRRPIVNDFIERKQLHIQISKELEKVED